jgi:hypothetical protein
MSKTYVTIKQIIIERQAASRLLRRRIREARGLERHNLWLEKRSYGKETRYLLLAYAMLRGVRRAALEKRCESPPSPSAIADIAARHAPEADFTLERVKEWLADEQR